MSVSWREAGKHDAVALQRFICTDPPKRNYDRHRGQWHPAPWEIEVQSHLRGRHPPVPPDEKLVLGVDPVGIAAAVHFGFDQDGEHFIIFAVACAHRCRGRGYGLRAVELALEVCRATKARYALDCAVFTRIDPRNTPSRKMAEAAGFEYLNQYDDGYESWIRDLD